jgi:methionine-rich copper-binding protein CopC
MNTRTFLRTAFVVAAGILAIGATSTPSLSAALRHTRLVKASPADKDTLTVAPTSLKLWYNEKVELPAMSLKLAGTSGAAVTLGAVTRDSVNAVTSVVAPITGKLAPDTYTVSWSLAGADGHPVKGTYSFVLRAR